VDAFAEEAKVAEAMMEVAVVEAAEDRVKEAAVQAATMADLQA
jgi:hypothetical protein